MCSIKFFPFLVPDPWALWFSTDQVVPADQICFPWPLPRPRNLESSMLFEFLQAQKGTLKPANFRSGYTKGEFRYGKVAGVAPRGAAFPRSWGHRSCKTRLFARAFRGKTSPFSFGRPDQFSPTIYGQGGGTAIDISEYGICNSRARGCALPGWYPRNFPTVGQPRTYRPKLSSNFVFPDWNPSGFRLEPLSHTSVHGRGVQDRHKHGVKQPGKLSLTMAPLYRWND